MDTALKPHGKAKSNLTRKPKKNKIVTQSLWFIYGFKMLYIETMRLKVGLSYYPAKSQSNYKTWIWKH